MELTLQYRTMWSYECLFLIRSTNDIGEEEIRRHDGSWMVKGKSSNLWNDEVWFSKRLKVFCDDGTYSKWALAELERQIHGEEHRELSLFEKEALSIPAQIGYFYIWTSQ